MTADSPYGMKTKTINIKHRSYLRNNFGKYVGENFGAPESKAGQNFGAPKPEAARNFGAPDPEAGRNFGRPEPEAGCPQEKQ